MVIALMNLALNGIHANHLKQLTSAGMVNVLLIHHCVQIQQIRVHSTNHSDAST